jgi:hypothetical protein
MRGRYRIGIGILIGLIGILMLFPSSPIHSLAAAYFQKSLEDRFGCSIEHERLFIHPLGGMAEIVGLTVETPADSNPKWSMKVKKAVLRFQYESLLRKRRIREVQIDRLEFKREELLAPALPVQKGSEEEEKPALPSGPGSKPKLRTPVRIERLVLRNGSVEIIRTDSSGGRRHTKASGINLLRTDVSLDKSLRLLVEQLLGSTESTRTPDPSVPPASSPFISSAGG